MATPRKTNASSLSLTQDEVPSDASPESLAGDALDRLSAIEQRLAALERQSTQERVPVRPKTALTSEPLPEQDLPRYWALEQLQAIAPKGGAVLYTGTIEMANGRRYIWQNQANVAQLMKLDWADLSLTVSALGHPVRLAVLKACLGQGRTTQDLLALPDMGTTGQLFHHLKALQEAGWLRSLQRGVYEVPGERVIPLLAILTAAQG